MISKDFIQNDDIQKDTKDIIIQNNKFKKLLFIFLSIISFIVIVDGCLLVSNRYVDIKLKNADIHIESNEKYEALLELTVSKLKLNSFLHSITMHGRALESTPSLSTTTSSISSSSSSSSSKCDIFSYYKSSSSSYLTQVDLISDVNLNKGHTNNKMQVGISRSSFSDIKDYLLYFIDHPDGDIMRFDCNMDITIYAFSLLPIHLQIPISQKMNFKDFKFSANVDVKEVNTKHVDASNNQVKVRDQSNQVKKIDSETEMKFEIPSLSYTDVMVKASAYFGINTNNITIRMHVPKMLIEMGKDRIYHNYDKSSALVLESAPVVVTMNEDIDFDLHVYCDPSSVSESSSCALHYPFIEFLPDLLQGKHVHANLLLNGENYLYKILNNDHDIDIYSFSGSILDESASTSRELLSSTAFPASCATVTFDNNEISEACGGIGRNYFGFYFNLDSFKNDIIDLQMKAFWGDNLGETGLNINVDSHFQYNNQYYYNGSFNFSEDEKFMNHSINVFSNDDSIFEQKMNTVWNYTNSFIQGSSSFYTTISDDNDRSYTSANFSLSDNAIFSVDATNSNVDSDNVETSSFELSSLVNLNITNISNWTLILDYFSIAITSNDDSYENTVNATASLVTKNDNNGIFSLTSTDVDTNGLVYKLLTTVSFWPSNITDSSATDVTGFDVVFNESVSDVSGFVIGKSYGSSIGNWEIDVYNANIIQGGDQIVSPTFDIYVNCSNILGDIDLKVKTTQNGDTTYNLNHALSWNANQDKGYFKTDMNQYSGEWTNRTFSTSWNATAPETYLYNFNVEDTSYKFYGFGTGMASGNNAWEWDFSSKGTFFSSDDGKEIASPSCYFKSNISSPTNFFFKSETQSRLNSQIVWYSSQTTKWSFLSSGLLYHKNSMYQDNQISNKSAELIYTQEDSSHWNYQYNFKESDKNLLVSGSGKINAKPNFVNLQLTENQVSRSGNVIDTFYGSLSASVSSNSNVGSFSFNLNNYDKLDQNGIFNSSHSLIWNTNHNFGYVQVEGDLTVSTSTLYSAISNVTYSSEDSITYDSQYLYTVDITEESSDFKLAAVGLVGFSSISYFDFSLAQCKISAGDMDYFPSGEVQLITAGNYSTGTFKIRAKNIENVPAVNYTNYYSTHLLSWDVKDNDGHVKVASSIVTSENDLLYNFTMGIKFNTVVYTQFDSNDKMLLGSVSSSIDYDNDYAFVITMNEYVGNFNMTGSGYLFEDSGLSWFLYFNNSMVYVDEVNYGSPFVIILANVTSLGQIFFKQGWYQSDGVQLYAVDELISWDYSTPSSAGLVYHNSTMYVDDDTYDNDLLFDFSQVFSYSEGADSYYGYYFAIKTNTASSDNSYDDNSGKSDDSSKAINNKFLLDTEGTFFSDAPLDWLFSVSNLNATINGEQYFDMTGLIQMNASADGDVGNIIMESTIGVQGSSIYDGSNQLMWSYIEDQFTLGYEGSCSSNQVDIFSIDFSIGVDINLEHSSPTAAPTTGAINMMVTQTLQNFPSSSYQDFLNNEAVYIRTITETIVSSTNSQLGSTAIDSENIIDLQVSQTPPSSTLHMLSTMSLYLTYYIETSNPLLSTSMLSNALTTAVTSTSFQGSFSYYLQQYSTANGVPALGSCSPLAPTVYNLNPTLLPTTNPTLAPAPAQTKKNVTGVVVGVTVAVVLLIAASGYLYMRKNDIKFASILSALSSSKARRVSVVPSDPRVSVLGHRISMADGMNARGSVLDHRISIAIGEGVLNPINPITPVSHDVQFSPDNQL